MLGNVIIFNRDLEYFWIYSALKLLFCLGFRVQVLMTTWTSIILKFSSVKLYL